MLKGERQLGEGALEGVVPSALDPSWGEAQSQLLAPHTHLPLPFFPQPRWVTFNDAEA